MSNIASWPAVDKTLWPNWTQPQLTAVHAKDGSILVQYEGKRWSLYWDGNLYVGTYWPVHDEDNCATAASVWADKRLEEMRKHPASGSMLWNAEKKQLVDRPGARMPSESDRGPAPSSPQEGRPYVLKPGQEKVRSAPEIAPRKKQKIDFKKDDRDDELE
jgi:hypothetical protein